jgi:hypothetical protein
MGKSARQVCHVIAIENLTQVKVYVRWGWDIFRKT